MAQQPRNKTLDAQSTAELCTEHSKEIAALTREVMTAIQSLKDLSGTYRHSFKEFMFRHFFIIGVAIIVVALVILAIKLPCFDFAYGEIRLTKPCVASKSMLTVPPISEKKP